MQQRMMDYFHIANDVHDGNTLLVLSSDASYAELSLVFAFSLVSEAALSYPKLFVCTKSHQ